MEILPANQTKLDILSFGEVMLRFDPGEERIRTANTFTVGEGGGEYNVARALSKCFRLRSGIVTSLVDNAVGRLIEDFIDRGNFQEKQILWKAFDGIGRETRNPLNFVERGFGIRKALGVSDRGHSPLSLLQKGEIDWETLFQKKVRWFHTGGICAALSPNMGEIIEEAIEIAHRHQAIVSYDLNYRASLWKNFGGEQKAIETNRKLVKKVDFLVGNEEDFFTSLGLSLPGKDGNNLLHYHQEDYLQLINELITLYPHIQGVAITLRKVHSATLNDFTAILWHKGNIIKGMEYKNVEVLDRVGGGDSFLSGLIYGFLEGLSDEESLAFGIANGVFALTTPKDTVSSSIEELKELIAGKSPRISR